VCIDISIKEPGDSKLKDLKAMNTLCIATVTPPRGFKIAQGFFRSSAFIVADGTGAPSWIFGVYMIKKNVQI
jgi:hypothetical protein